jgi:hypothetical protein
MKNYFEEFYKRYADLKTDLEKKGSLAIGLNLEKVLTENPQGLNNLVMAGLGMGTLYLRMGAVLMIAEKTSKDQGEEDVSFLKVIAEKLIHKLPADGEWKDIWKAYLLKDINGNWNGIIEDTPSSLQSKGNIYELFVSFRNDIVHQKIVIKPGATEDELKEISIGLAILDAMSAFRMRFGQSIIGSENNEVYFQYHSDSEKLKVSPYVQINKAKELEDVGILPYLFQGKYNKGSKFINTEGSETDEEKDDSVDETFDKIKKDISRFNGDKAFDFQEKIKNYNEWCIGRESEVNFILYWINDSETDKNVLPIYAAAGLGKGALVADAIVNLEKSKINCLFHFCGSGPQNNLQAILYHLIIQGKEKKYWKTKSLSSEFQSKLDRLPSQYSDVIKLFQGLMDAENVISENEISNALDNPNIDGRFNTIYDVLIKMIKQQDNDRLEEILNQYFLDAKQLIDIRGHKLQTDYYQYIFDIHFSITQYGLKSDLLDLVPENHRKLSKKYLQPLVIIIDGLDEASVADHSKRISDWFYTYKDDAPNADDIRSKRADKWISPKHIKWIFTFRYSKDESKKIKQYDYPNEIKAEFNIEENESLQPLKPLNITAEELNKALMIDLKENMNENAPTLTDAFINAILEKGKIKDDKAESPLK